MNALENRLSDRGGKFDAVYANYFLHLFRANERELLFAQMRQLLGPHGILVLSLISTHDHLHRTGKPLEPNTYEVFQGRFWHFFSRTEILRLCKRVDLRVSLIQETVENECIAGEPNTVTSWRLLARR
jgi:SAM-dependent methyltransferase